MHVLIVVVVVVIIVERPETKYWEMIIQGNLLYANQCVSSSIIHQHQHVSRGGFSIVIIHHPIELTSFGTGMEWDGNDGRTGTVVCG